MAFETERKKYAREPFKYYEVEVGGTTYKICENVGPIPAGLDAIPLVKSASKRPPRVSLEGGIGLRASISVGFNEGLDYRYFGTESAPVRFWINWRARNVGYQGGRISEFSGYIVNGAYDLLNFERRDYIIESFSHNASGASITGKDTLKMISGDRAKAPRKSEGILSATLLVGATTFDLTPAGIGNSSYPASGWIRLGDEVVSFTRSADTFTIVRAQYNTLAEEHGINDLAQLCLYYSNNISDILYDLYTVYADVPTAQINKPQWDDEINLNLPGLYETLITEPVGVDALAKELCESAPHFQYYDERINSIVLTAIKAPPDILQCYTAEANILEASSNIKDEPEMRISTVIVRFGQRDPTKKLDDASNYKQAQVRITPLSIAKYGGVEKYKIINSRWVSNGNRAAAIRLAARVGRRFEEMPRSIGYNLDSRDADVWTGQSMAINSDLTLRNSAPYDRFCMPVQVFSVGESKDYQYQALEHTYGAALPEDEDSDDPNYRPVYISGQTIRIEDASGSPQTLREAYDAVWPDLLAAYNVVFIFDLSAVAGSDDAAEYAVVTSAGDEFSVLSTPILIDVRGLIVGKGGKGADVAGVATDGGPAMLLRDDIRLSNTGKIGGGGGGGNEFALAADLRSSGGGGAGYENGVNGTGELGEVSTTPSEAGSNENGGVGGEAVGDFGGSNQTAVGGAGGDLGDAGEFSGGAAGAAIALNGYTITYINTGTILGTVS
jgi:hypothetical protein